MKISNTAPQHLSNYEVLEHFLQVKKETGEVKRLIDQRRIRKAQAALEAWPPKNEEDYPEVEYVPPLTDKLDKEEDTAERRGQSEELVWIQEHVLKYLCSDYMPTGKQNAEGVTSLARDLQSHGLTKGEVLQLVNLAPTEPVELYAVIEEVDLRFLPDAQTKLEEIGDQIRNTLSSEIPPHLAELGSRTPGSSEPQSGAITPTVDTKIAGWRDTLGEGGEGAVADEFVHEAEWGRDKEEAVDDEPDNDME